MSWLSRRNLLRTGLYGGLASGLGTACYSRFGEARWLDLHELKIPLTPAQSDLDGIRLTVLTDFHHDEWGDSEYIDEVVRQVNAENLDFVILAGDFITNDIHAFPELVDRLSRLTANRGVFAMLGNHDHWHYDPIIDKLFSELGIRLLRNEATIFDQFAVVGLESNWGGRPDLSKALARVPPEMPVILGWHEPDNFDLYDDPRIILQVAGHTHGGQVCAPIHGPILLPSHGRKYARGHFQRRSSHLFVTRGIGISGVPFRFLCRPEIPILKFEYQANQSLITSPCTSVSRKSRPA
ncbi:MAG: metallophosphoesterase [Verrucomicrobiota bacterium]